MIRRAIGTTLVGLCALTGPLSGSAFAAVTPALTLAGLSTPGSARPGVPFTINPATGCPADSGPQTVELTFTDKAGVAHSIGSLETEDDGSWADAVAQLPVTGVDDDGEWSNSPVAAGLGSVGATCFGTDGSADADDEDGFAGAALHQAVADPDDDSADPGDDDFDDEPGDDGDNDDSSDDSGDDAVITQAYAPIALTAVGTAPKITLSATLVKPGNSVTVTPQEACAAGTTSIDLALVAIGVGSDDGDDEDAGVADDLPATTVTPAQWALGSPLTLPSDADTGDYAVTATCSDDDGSLGSYAAAPLAAGTVLIGAATCTAKGANVALTGTYSGEISGDDASLPARQALTGDGPWTVKVSAADTGLMLATRTLTCAKPQYDVDVLKTGLSTANKPQARACNTGRAPVTAILQVLSGKKYQQVDKEALDPGECSWLQGGKLDKSTTAKAKVLIDAPGKGADAVVTSFTVKRGKK